METTFRLFPFAICDGLKQNYRLILANFLIASAFWNLVACLPAAYAKVAEPEPVTISVILVNPSAEKKQKFPVKVDLPQEVTPDILIDGGNLKLEYDDKRSIYYLFNEEIELEPKETRVLKVVVKDVWRVPQHDLDQLKARTQLLANKMKNTEYAETANDLAKSVYERLDQIKLSQEDQTLTQKRRIGNYRYHLQTISKIKEDLDNLEKLLALKGGVPVPEMLEQSKLKSDAPSTKTTWLLIFIIMLFLGLIGGQFFMTWQRRAQAEKEFDEKRKRDLPGASADDEEISNKAV